MTEQEWLACTDPQKMLEYLGDKASERKLRLLAVACCRRVWGQLTGPRFREAVERSERFADGQDEAKELAALAAPLLKSWRMPADRAAGVTASVELNARVAWEATRVASWAAPRHSRADEQLAQALLVREVFGDPFRPVSLDVLWLTPTVQGLGRAAYDDRRLPAGLLDATRLAVLADALEEAGCTNADLLGHLRGPGAHVCGCWALDLLLGKQ